MKSAEYFAGIFDGEGCVGVYSFGKWKSLCLRCQVAMCSKIVTTMFKLRYGGFTRNSQLKSGKTIYYWIVNSKIAEAFLKEIAPHSVVKREQIMAALEFQEKKGNYLNWRKGKSGYAGLPEDVKSLRLKLQQKVNALA